MQKLIVSAVPETSDDLSHCEQPREHQISSLIREADDSNTAKQNKLASTNTLNTMCRLRAESSDHPTSSVLCVLTAASSVCSARRAEQYQHDEFMTLHLCKHYSLKNLVCTTPILKTCAEKPSLPVKNHRQMGGPYYCRTSQDRNISVTQKGTSCHNLEYVAEKSQ